MTIDWSAVAAANTFGAGPASGGDAVPTLRKIVYADLDASVRAALLADIICNIGSDFPQWLEFALIPVSADSTVTLTTGVKFVDRTPGFEFVDGFVPRASCRVVSSSGPVTIDIKFGSTGGAGGTSIFSTKLTIDEGEYTSLSAIQPILTTDTHVDDEEMTITIDAAGTGVQGLLVRLPVFWTVF